MISFLRPVASTAARTSGCAQEFDDGRSIGVISGKTSLISLKIGSLRTLPRAPTVVRIVGTPRSFATRTSPRRTAGTSMSACRTAATTISTRASSSGKTRTNSSPP
jgi:hypothetical protein